MFGVFEIFRDCKFSELYDVRIFNVFDGNLFRIFNIYDRILVIFDIC